MAEALGETPRIVVDFTRCTFCDLAGVNLLLSASKCAAERDGALAVSGVRDALWKVFRATGLDAALPAFDTSADAVAALAKSGEVHPSWLAGPEPEATKFSVPTPRPPARSVDRAGRAFDVIDGGGDDPVQTDVPAETPVTPR